MMNGPTGPRIDQVAEPLPIAFKVVAVVAGGCQRSAGQVQHGLRLPGIEPRRLDGDSPGRAGRSSIASRITKGKWDQLTRKDGFGWACNGTRSSVASASCSL